MCQQFCETVSNYYPLILAGIFGLAVASIIFFVQGSDERQDVGGSELEDISPRTVTEDKVIRDSRYDVKKYSRCNKDVNRWGRWSLEFRSGKKKTAIGMLYAVLENNPQAYKYKEIK